MTNLILLLLGKHILLYFWCLNTQKMNLFYHVDPYRQKKFLDILHLGISCPWQVSGGFQISINDNIVIYYFGLKIPKIYFSKIFNTVANEFITLEHFISLLNLL